MLNLINSDIFRVRKGTALYGVIGGIFSLFLLMTIIFRIIGSPVFNDLMDTAESTGGLTVVESNTGISTDLQEVKNEVEEFLPDNGAEFTLSMLTEASNSLALFLLPLIISVFGADFSSGAFRNLLSYESGRRKIYISKLITTLIFAIIMLLSYVVLSGLLGSLFFGWGGFNKSILSHIFGTLLLQLPVYLALISLGHCILAFSKKCSYTIAIYIVGLLVWAIILQMFAMTVPGLLWLLQFDFLSILNTMGNFNMLSAREIAVPVIFSISVILVSLGLGVYKYKTTDFDFY